MNIVICCSLSQLDKAKELKTKIINRTGMTNKSIVIPMPAMSGEFMSDHREDFLTALDAADLVFIFEKLDGTIGESTSYELAYCKHMNTPYIIVGDEKPYIKEEPQVEAAYSVYKEVKNEN